MTAEDRALALIQAQYELRLTQKTLSDLGLVGAADEVERSIQLLGKWLELEKEVIKA